MQDKYAGDTPDFGKFTLLRAVAGVEGDGPILHLGVNWYYTVDVDAVDNTHGNKRGHTKARDRFRSINPNVWDLLEPIQSDRSVAALESSGVLPADAFFYRETVPEGPRREAWFRRGVEVVKPSDVVFFDPDTGFEVPSMSDDETPKYTLYSELPAHMSVGQTLIVYQTQPHEVGEYRLR